MRVNITIEEIRTLLLFAEKKPEAPVTLHIEDVGGIGNVFQVSKTWDSEKTNITNYGAW